MILENNDEKATRLKAIGADDVNNYRSTPAWHLDGQFNVIGPAVHQ